MTVNKQIQIGDYNSIRSKVVTVLGSGSTTFGYGQIVQSSAVDVGDTIGINDWGLLAYDIINTYVHQDGTTPALPSVVTGNVIKSDSDLTSCTASFSGTVMYVRAVSSGMLAIGQTLTGTGISGSTVITGQIDNPTINISSFIGVTPLVINLPLTADPTPQPKSIYLVEFSVTAQPIALPVGVNYTIAGNSNDKFNGTFLSYAATSSSVTLIYNNDPGTYGSGTTTLKVTESNPWGYSTWTINNSHTLSSRSVTANSSTTHPITYYDTIATTLGTNRFNIAQFITTNKGSNSQSWPGSLGTFWNTRVYCTITMTFTNANRARYFFNSGGKITFQSSLTSPASSNNQILGWQNLLSGLGSSATWGGISFFSLTSSYAQIFSAAASGAYTGNFIRISARTPGVTNNNAGTANIIEFFVEWVDNYTDPVTGGGRDPQDFPPGDRVDGTLSISSVTTEAFGTLVPAGTGNFTVESPTISYGAFAQDANGPDFTPPPPTYSISPSTSSVNEGSSVSWTITTTGFGSGTLYYTNSGTTNASDFTDGLNSGSITITSNSGTLTKTLTNESVTEGSETIIIQLRTGSTSGTIVATASSVTVNDTSTTPPTYSISPSVSSVNEGGSISWTITTTNFGSGTLYYTNSGTTNASDFTDGLTSGSITITSNSGTLTKTLTNDVATEGSETIIMQLRTGSTSGSVVATASSVTVNDTSTAPPPASETYTTTDTNIPWSKPATLFTSMTVQIWGGGGGGETGSNDTAAGGGGGGAYIQFSVNYDDIPSTGTIFVGSGGGVQTPDNAPGLDGGNSSFLGAIAGGGGGGGRSGLASAGAAGAILSAPSVTYFDYITEAGGAGGPGTNASQPAGNGGSTTYAGAGGGGGGETSGAQGGAGGTSTFGGNGGTGGGGNAGAPSPTAGTAPGGGGGGDDGQGRVGARGEIRISYT